MQASVHCVSPATVFSSNFWGAVNICLHGVSEPEFGAAVWVTRPNSALRRRILTTRRQSLISASFRVSLLFSHYMHAAKCWTGSWTKIILRLLSWIELCSVFGSLNTPHGVEHEGVLLTRKTNFGLQTGNLCWTSLDKKWSKHMSKYLGRAEIGSEQFF